MTSGGWGAPSDPIDLSDIYQVESAKLLTFLALSLGAFLPQVELLVLLGSGAAPHPLSLPVTILLVTVSDFLTIYFSFSAVARYDILAAIEADHTYPRVKALVKNDRPDGGVDSHFLARAALSVEQYWFTRVRFRWVLPLVGIPALVLVVSWEVVQSTL